MIALSARREPRPPTGLTATSQILNRWQLVAFVAGSFDFRAHRRRFNPQTQYLFVSRRSRTPRGALFPLHLFRARSSRGATFCYGHG